MRRGRETRSEGGETGLLEERGRTEMSMEMKEGGDRMTRRERDQREKSHGRR